MSLGREQAIQELGELIRRPPWGGGGPYPAGAKILQNISRGSKLWDEIGRNRLQDWSRSGAVDPFEVADILLDIKLDGKLATAGAFELTEAVSTACNRTFDFADEWTVSIYLLSALLKIEYYGIRDDLRRRGYVIYLRNKAIEDFPDYDPYTSHEPFKPWSSPRDETGKWLIKPSHPQLRRTIWNPPKQHFKTSFMYPSPFEHTFLPPDDEDTEDDYEEHVIFRDSFGAEDVIYQGERYMNNAPRVWVQAVNHLESTVYSINQEMLEIIDQLPAPLKEDVKLERRFRQLIKERISSGIDKLDKKQKKNKSLDEERKDKGLPKLKDNDPKRPITPAEVAKRGKYYKKWYHVVETREAIKSKHDLHIRILKRAKELGTRPFWNRAFVDYRGRMYLSRSVVNYQTGDMSRGLMQFAEGRRVRKKDMSYLWIHIANAWGQKGDVTTREKFAKKHQKKWLRYARRPVETHDEWKDAGDKWVFIRACLELRTLLKDPKHKSQLIVEIDQSMSALQHIALICSNGAMQARVNLGRDYRDAYTEIGENVKELQDVEGSLKRKIVKWAMVPWAYGGNTWTAYEHYLERREDVEFFRKMNDQKLYRLARSVIQAIESEFPAMDQYQTIVRELGQKQLDDKRRKIPRIHWTTPADFEVHHYEQITKPDDLELISYKPRTRLIAAEPKEESDTDEMLKALPPNFVHSQDAAIAQLVLFYSNKKGQPCITVHDAMGVHLCHAESVKKSFITAFAYIYMRSPLTAFYSDKELEEKGMYSGVVPPVKDADYVPGTPWDNHMNIILTAEHILI